MASDAQSTTNDRAWMDAMEKLYDKGSMLKDAYTDLTVSGPVQSVPRMGLQIVIPDLVAFMIGAIHE